MANIDKTQILGGQIGMAALSAAFDNIRLIRRKVQIAQIEIEKLDPGPDRDQAMFRLNGLVDDLVRALNDFAEIGYEDAIADLIRPAQHYPAERA